MNLRHYLFIFGPYSKCDLLFLGSIFLDPMVLLKKQNILNNESGVLRVSYR